ncbi:MAG TPA: sugar ABC transporter ATP-binding protein, partial [Polyangiaceae bacterium]|nr:sugar ABC transporter ATP-binding protein [Polyangiaceae bacterium]
ENGAGKSTLIKVLAGVHAHGSYRGTIEVNGKAAHLSSPADARSAGIAVVHQELMLVSELSVAQNLLLGREPRRFRFIDDARLESTAQSYLLRFGFAGQIDPAKPVGELGIGMQQIVEIVRGLSLEARILVLDEPTAALSQQEARKLLDWLRKLKAGGTTCIYVSHRLDELFAICDRLTILRDGCTAATTVTADTTPERVVSVMVGRTLEGARSRAPFAATSREQRAVLEVKDFSVCRSRGKRGEAEQPRFALNAVSLSLWPGEIVAVAGAMGSGRTALLSGLFGCAEAGATGRILIEGTEVVIDSPLAAIRHGLALVPEDRKGRGLVLGMTVAENLALPSLASPHTMGRAARFGLVDATAESLLAERRIRSLQIRGGAASTASTLSGGNQQKVVLGKWLEHPPKVLLLDEPTRGVDVGAREEIYGILSQLALEGVAVLFASSDLSEILRLADRIIVLRQGRKVAELDGQTATEEIIVRLSTGALAAVSLERGVSAAPICDVEPSGHRADSVQS